MSEILNTVLEMSLYGSIAIVIVILFRLIFKKLPKKTMILIWSIVAFRLICPFNFDTGLGIASLIPQKQTTQVTTSETKSTPAATFPASKRTTPVDPVNLRNRHVSEVKNAESQKATETKTVHETKTVNIKPMDVACVVWITGMAAFSVYVIATAVKTTVITKRFRRKDGYLESDEISTPFTVGILKPTICIPSNLDEGEKDYMLLHEKIHLKNHDPAIKCLALGILCLHWFNPIVWIAYRLLLSDLEMRCDEKVVDIMGDTIRKDYCLSIVNHSVEEPGFQPVSTAFARKTFGGMEVKMRIKNLIKYKKTPVITSVLLLAFAGASTFALSSCATGKEDAKKEAKATHATIQASLESLSAKLDNEEKAEETEAIEETTKIEEEETEIIKVDDGERIYDPDLLSEDHNGIPVYFYEETRAWKDTFMSSYDVDTYINNIDAKEINAIAFYTDGVATIKFTTDDVSYASFTLAPNVEFSSLEEFDEYYSMKTYYTEYLGFISKPENEIVSWPALSSRDKEELLKNEFVKPEDVDFLNYPEASETDTGYQKVYTYDSDKKICVLFEYDKENKTVSCTDYMTGFPEYSEDEDSDPIENLIKMGFNVEEIDGVPVVWVEEDYTSKEWKETVLDTYGIEKVKGWVDDDMTITELYLGYSGIVTIRGYKDDNGKPIDWYYDIVFGIDFSSLREFDEYYTYANEDAEPTRVDEIGHTTRSVTTDRGYKKTFTDTKTGIFDYYLEYIAEDSAAIFACCYYD